MPALLSSVLAKRMGSTARSDHWNVRQYAAGIIAQACAKLGQAHANLQPRVTKEYVKAFSDEAKPPGTHYGNLVLAFLVYACQGKWLAKAWFIQLLFFEQLLHSWY